MQNISEETLYQLKPNCVGIFLVRYSSPMIISLLISQSVWIENPSCETLQDIVY